MLLATLCILLSSILTTQPSAAKKLTDLFPRDGLCGLSTQERLDTLRNIKEFEAADADGQDTDGKMLMMMAKMLMLMAKMLMMMAKMLMAKMLDL